MEKQKVMDLMDKFIERADEWVRDAKIRKNSTDIEYYEGQKKVIQDIKQTISNMWS